MNNIVLSPSKLNDFQICPRRYHYRYNLQLTPIEKKVWFEEGELMHEMLREFYTNNGDIGTVPAIIDNARNYSAVKLKLTAENTEQVIRDFRMYVDHYAQFVSNWQVLAVEEPFAKVIWEKADLRVIINGKTDLRVMVSGQIPMLVDHKYESQFRAKPDRDNQPLCYAWAYGIVDWLYNRIGKQKSYKPQDRLKRESICYSAHQVNDWAESAIAAALEMFGYYERDYFPARFSGCQGEKYKCDFYNICNTSPDNREYVINTQFSNKPEHQVMG